MIKKIPINDTQINNQFFVNTVDSKDDWYWFCRACEDWCYPLEEATDAVTMSERMAMYEHTLTNEHHYRHALAELANE